MYPSRSMDRSSCLLVWSFHRFCCCVVCVSPSILHHTFTIGRWEHCQRLNCIQPVLIEFRLSLVVILRENLEKAEIQFVFDHSDGQWCRTSNCMIRSGRCLTGNEEASCHSFISDIDKKHFLDKSKRG